MRPLVLDTNLYVEAARDRTKAKDLARFSSAVLPVLYLHAVVGQELLAGARGEDGRASIRRWLLRPFERRRRILVPSWGAWKRSGQLVSKLVERGKLSPGGFSRSFMNDALIAASLGEIGAVLITRNERDFSLLAEVESFLFRTPWPEAR